MDEKRWWLTYWWYGHLIAWTQSALRVTVESGLFPLTVRPSYGGTSRVPVAGKNVTAALSARLLVRGLGGVVALEDFGQMGGQLLP